MAFSQSFHKASAEVAEATRRNRLATDQIANLIAGSRRVLDASYDLLRDVERSLGETPAANSSNQPKTAPKNQYAVE